MSKRVVRVAITLAAALLLTACGAGPAARPDLALPTLGAAALLMALTLQLSFGTMIRHLNSKHGLYSHIAFSFIVMILASIVGAKIMRHKSVITHGPSLKRIGHGLTMVVGIQFILGWIALWAWMTSPLKDIASPTSELLAQAEAIRPMDVLARTVHQVNGALLMIATAVACVWVWSPRKS